VVITFDDGIQDFHRLVWPALRTHSFPATLYLCTHYVNRQLPVFDLACSYMLWRSLGKTLDWPRIIPAACILTEQNRTNITQTIQAYAWSESMTSEQKSALLEELAERLDFDYAELVRSRRLTLVSDNEAQEMAAEGLDIQLHTHRHQSPLDRASFFREIADNRSYIRRLTDKDPDHFAYPNGYHHPSHAAFLRELGVKTATTCYAGHTTRESPHLKLPRFVDSEAVPEAQFLAWCTGTADLLPHRKPVVPSSVEERRAHFESLAKPRRAAVE
jgi:hypothetical protein